MKLRSFNYLIGLILIFFCSHLLSEEKIDIWKNKKEIPKQNIEVEEKDNQGNTNFKISEPIKALDKIKIQDIYFKKTELIFIII